MTLSNKRVVYFFSILLFTIFMINSVSAKNPESCVIPFSGMVINEDTRLCPGTYDLEQGLLVDADNMTLDCNGAELVGKPWVSEDGIYMEDRKNVVIKNCVVKHFERGLRLRNVENSSFIDNTIAENLLFGIHLFNAKENFFYKNTLYKNRYGMFFFSGIEDNIIMFNVFDNVVYNLMSPDTENREPIVIFNYWPNLNPLQLASKLFVTDEEELIHFCPYLGSSKGKNDCDSTNILREEIKFTGRDEYILKFFNEEGTEYHTWLVDNSRMEVPFFRYGSEDGDTIFVEGGSYEDFIIDIGDLFILTSGDITKVMAYNGIDTFNKILKFEDRGQGPLDVPYHDSLLPGVLGEAELNLIGDTFKIYISDGLGRWGKASEYEHPISVDLNGDDDIDGDEANIVVRGGGIMDLGEQHVSNFVPYVHFPFINGRTAYNS